LNISHPTFWYRVSCAQLSQVGGYSLLKTLPSALKSIYPTFNWDKSLFPMVKKKSIQGVLLHCIKELFPGRTVFEEYRTGLRYKSSEEWIDLDIFVPSLNLALEYNGEHHYTDNRRLFGPSILQEKRDLWKLERCRENGITIIPIPYWWKYDMQSLVATIKHYRPDIVMRVPDENYPPLLSRDNNSPLKDKFAIPFSVPVM